MPLVITRAAGEGFTVGDIHIRVMKIRGREAVLAITAPRELAVRRLTAAEYASLVDDLKAKQQKPKPVAVALQELAALKPAKLPVTNPTQGPPSAGIARTPPATPAPSQARLAKPRRAA